MIHCTEKNNQICIAACPNPLTLERVDMCVPDGLCLREMIEIAAPRSLDLSAIVYVDDMPVERDRWETVYPRPGQLVTVRVIPEGGRQGKNVLRIVLSLAVMATTYWLGGPVVGWFGKWKGAFALGAVGAAGVYGVSRLVQLPEPTTDPTEGRVYSITGQNNRANLYGPIPKVYGQMKIFPSLAALPYTEIVGNDQWMWLLFVAGYGTLNLSDFRINDEPLEHFDAEIQYCTGADDDDDIDYPENIYENSLSVLLRQNDWTIRTTKTDEDADEISVDFTFPMGLCRYTDEGNREYREVELEAQYRPAEQAYLLYDGQTVAFADGETITGSTSGATAKIIKDTDWGTEGCLRVWKVAGTFQNNEAVTDSQVTPGAAVVNGTLGDLMLQYDNEASGPFTVGNSITGGTSGTVGTLRGLQDDGATGRMVIQAADGDYVNNEEIDDGTATADVAGTPDTAPWLPSNDATVEDICPGFDEWTLGGTASYDSGTGEITLATWDDYVDSPLMQLNYAPGFDFTAQYYSTDASGKYTPDAGYSMYVIYYNSWPHNYEQGDTFTDGSYDTGVWEEVTTSILTPTCDGPEVPVSTHILIRLESVYDATAESYKIKTPAVAKSYTYSYIASTNRTLRKTARWKTGDPGKYEVRVRRITADSTDDSVYDEVYWTALRTIMYGDVIVGIDNLAKIRLRVKATDQLGGVVDRFSCVASSVLPVYDTGTETWTDTETANPCLLYTSPSPRDRS